MRRERIEGPCIAFHVADRTCIELNQSNHPTGWPLQHCVEAQQFNREMLDFIFDTADEMEKIKPGTPASKMLEVRKILKVQSCSQTSHARVTQLHKFSFLYR